MNKKNNVWDNDAYGHLIWDYHKGDHDVVEIVERDDGYVDASSVLIHKYDNNGMFRFESIPTNNKRGVPFVVRKRRERKK
ncbi:hypothetical protein KAU32_03065, partial [bacterium]|nr:hypothetical protein [bacterium]